jgi:hypothetical protein
MEHLGSRRQWVTLLLVVILAAGLLGLTVLFGRLQPRARIRRDGVSNRSTTDLDRRGAIADESRWPREGTAGPGQATGATGLRLLPSIPSTFGDPRFQSLRRAAMAWRQSTGPPRLVVDQVCLVPDVPTFFEAIAAWDEGHFFPILIDEPGWTLPFLRAFHPARVVRYPARGDGRAVARSATESPRSPAARLALWQRAIEAVAKGWSGASPPDGKFPPAGSPPRGLGPTPPGVVLSAPDSPMLAGAVALAAGRFQPLVRLEPAFWTLDDPRDAGRIYRFGDILTLPQALRFAQRLEARVASVTPHYDQLGDDCDFLTIAGDWPYRYNNDVERGPVRGLHALDDLIGRNLEGDPAAQGLDRSRLRWAFSGRLLGDPAASVAQAMGALFLRPDATLLWDTYNGGIPWSDYSLYPAADRLSRSPAGRDSVFLRSGARADLESWHKVVDPRNRLGFVWINSSGEKQRFAIAGGPGRPADLPAGYPSAVVMVHSFSAAEPADPQTIAGRWLAQGAFVYFGSVNEPYVQAFRPARLVVEMAVAEVPLGAALRQGEFEPFGRPWRLIYLGDPLYRLPIPDLAIAPSALDARDPATSDFPPPDAASDTRLSTSSRLPSRAWRRLEPSSEDWPVVEVTASGSPPTADSARPDETLLRWCRDAAIVELVASLDPDDRRPPPAGSPRLESLSVLKRIRREQLDRNLRPIYDDLLIDALRDAGELDELQARLARIPPDECRPRIWQSLENVAMARLARLAGDRDPVRAFVRSLDLWDGVIRLSWPAGSEFPAQLTERVATMAHADPPRRLSPWLDRLRRAGDELAARPGQSPQTAIIAAERARIEARIGAGS